MFVVLACNLIFMLFSSFAAYHDFCIGRNGWGIVWSMSAFLAAFLISFGIEDIIMSSKKDKEVENEKQVQE